MNNLLLMPASKTAFRKCDSVQFALITRVRVHIKHVVSATVFRLNALNHKIIKGAVHSSDKYTTLASCEHVWYREQVFLLGYFMPKKRALTGLKRPIKKPTRQMSLVHTATDSSIS